jgi:hypothetical protein
MCVNAVIFFSSFSADDEENHETAKEPKVEMTIQIVATWFLSPGGFAQQIENVRVKILA